MSSETPNQDPLAALRDRLAAASTTQAWRSLEELAETPLFLESLKRELPQYAAEWPPELERDFGRRDFLRLVAAGLALGGMSACTPQPPEAIRPYVHQPEQMTVGKALYFATAMSVGGYATGVLVRSNEGRPTKIEGNPDHPASLGATDRFSQASVLDLYDPDRSQVVLQHGEMSSWLDFLGVARQLRQELRAAGSAAGLRILTETVSSPTLFEQIQALLTELPGAQWHQWDPLPRDAALLGAEQAFGAPVESIYHIERAERVLSIDADFLSCTPRNLRYAHDFALRRRPEHGSLARLYAIETTPTNTGAVADHRLSLRPGRIDGVVRALAAALGVRTGGATPSLQQLVAEPDAAFLSALARDLLAHRGASLVLVGDSLPPHLHALGHAMNQALLAVGNTVVYTQPVAARPVPQLASLRALCADLAAGRVDVLLIVDSSGGCNPGYSAPVDLRFSALAQRARLRVHFGPYIDETAALCQWHLPAAHYLESWSDARAYDGTLSIVQPLIAPLYQGRTAHEVLACFTDQPERSAYELVRGAWRARYPGPDFEDFWQRTLDRGVAADTAFLPIEVTLQRLSLPPLTPAAAGTAAELEVVFRADAAVYDGRFANNAWLQELPRPLDRLTWDSVAHISPQTARRLGLGLDELLHGREVAADVVEVSYRGRALQAPIWIQPGHPDGCITLTLGYGRTRAGHIGNRVGYNAYALRPADALWHGSGLVLRKTGKRHVLAATQLHFLMDGRSLVRSGSLAEYKKDPTFGDQATEGSKPTPRSLTLYPGHTYPGYAWGMAIDLSTCIGCKSCVLACQAENNIPVVGKQQVQRGREMHWLRIDHYYKGSLDNPESYFQPVPCMHCENAPCEYVCPVGATLHSAEGLNDMVYNRCIGTRYCSNNCPYKVRRFNFLLYWDSSELASMQKNPWVTVRSRGVMEKCSYCVQRITAARIRSEEEQRKVRDGEIKTACQAACPADAIVFGDINDPSSRVAKLKALPRNYELLGELNTRPRTTYLAAVRNPNPEIKGS
jgi:molybdopterin-containing oxidoreductase family iron-sulfur binding subunit